jgi:RNA polymerase sigma factor (sigma-70 family)
MTVCCIAPSLKPSDSTGGQPWTLLGSVAGRILAPSTVRARCREVPVEAGDSSPTILQRVALGEPGAAQECLDRFGGLVWSLARRLASNDSEAEDAVQEIFVDVWRSSQRYDPSIASETAFVAMIARRRLIDQRRKASRRKESPIGEHDPAGTRASDRTQVSEEASKAAAALELLSEDQQKVLRLSIFHGLSHEKIARSTGLPLGTVKTHARRGLIRVRQLLSDADPAVSREAKPLHNGQTDGLQQNISEDGELNPKGTTTFDSRGVES